MGKTMPGLDWQSYLKPVAPSVAAHRARSAEAFACQKENIGKLCRILHPRTVVCMGAGYLNDIPVDDLIAIDADIYFAERIEGITQQAFHYDLVKQITDQFICLACKCCGDPHKYCKNYCVENPERPSLPDADQTIGHCDNFLRAEDNAWPSCANYAAGEFPRFLRADVTQGVAQHFATQVPAVLKRASKPRQALNYAIHACPQPRAEASLPLSEHSVDFITSSMVASQFDFEPYTYFIRNLFLHFGQQAIEQNIDALGSLLESLRDRLFLTQMEGHCGEMLRLLKPEGRIYFSIEVLHSGGVTEPYFQSEVACKAMSIIGRYFYFDLQTLPDIVTPAHAAMVAGGKSLIQSWLLFPKSSPHN